MEAPGTQEGEICGRDGCKGVLVRDYGDEDYVCAEEPGCHCGYCLDRYHMCPECGWHEDEESEEESKK